jgi:catechol 2,3-dioxygenase-like lactoylglutathione lyase family enzyme
MTDAGRQSTGLFRRVDHVHVATRDIEASIRFYTTVLGFRLVRRVKIGTQEPAPQIAYVSLDGFMIEFSQVRHGNALQGTEALPLGLSVDDLDEAMEMFHSHGVEIVSPPRRALSFAGRQASIRDPSGVVLEVRQWDPEDFPMSADWVPEIEGVTRLD